MLKLKLVGSSSLSYFRKIQLRTFSSSKIQGIQNRFQKNDLVLKSFRETPEANSQSFQFKYKQVALLGSRFYSSSFISFQQNDKEKNKGTQEASKSEKTTEEILAEQEGPFPIENKLNYGKLLFFTIISVIMAYFQYKRSQEDPNNKFWKKFADGSLNNHELENLFKEFVQNNKEYGVYLKMSRDLTLLEIGSPLFGSLLGAMIGPFRFKYMPAPVLVKLLLGIAFGFVWVGYLVPEVIYFHTGRKRLYEANSAFVYFLKQKNAYIGVLGAKRNEHQFENIS